MSRIVFLPGFDGEAELRGDFVAELRRRHDVVAVSYPNSRLGSLDGYRQHAMAQVPIDWSPVLVAESFSGLVASLWASVDARVEALVLCGSFARNPLGYMTHMGAAMPALVKLGPAMMNPAAQLSGDPARRRWSAGFTRSLAGLRDDVVAERMRLIATEDMTDALCGLAIPVVVLNFDDDLVVGPLARQHLERSCSRARVVRLPGPHFSLEVRPRECAEAIETALAAA